DDQRDAYALAIDQHGCERRGQAAHDHEHGKEQPEHRAVELHLFGHERVDQAHAVGREPEQHEYDEPEDGDEPPPVELARRHDHTRSRITATPCPTPTHIVQ